MDKQSQAELARLISEAYQTGMARGVEIGRGPAQPAAPSPQPDFKLNSQGQPEFASIVLRLDHLIHKDTGHVIIKSVLSSESAEDALRSLLDYYEETDAVFKMRSTVEQLYQARQSPEAGIFLYMPNATDASDQPFIEAIMSTSAFSLMVQHPDYGAGSEMVCVTKLIIAFQNILDAQKGSLGAYPALTFLRLDRLLKEEVPPTT